MWGVQQNKTKQKKKKKKKKKPHCENVDSGPIERFEMHCAEKWRESIWSACHVEHLRASPLLSSVCSKVS
jgi:hypothetical protein